MYFFCFQAEDGIRDLVRSRGLGDVYKRQTVGQVNGLLIRQIGNHAFGRPSRITASIRIGSGEVIDIERQVDMGGPLHSKGVLILAGFLGQRFATERPLSLSATLVFEPSYGGGGGR